MVVGVLEVFRDWWWVGMVYLVVVNIGQGWWLDRESEEGR